ncbi:hypothetical protein N7528_010366 [Penicillium herquei]|nr:hypothetical protein N7528_010366 [Penicillium herquei]
MYLGWHPEGGRQRVHRPAVGACGPFEIDTFEDKLMKYRDECISSLKTHLGSCKESYFNATEDEEWIEKWDWEQAKPNKEIPEFADAASFQIATKVFYKKKKPCFPPPFSRLSDELVFLATKFINAGVRWKLYPYDFVMSGDIDPERVPTGPAPVVWAYGLPFLPVYKGYYVLTGRQHACWAGWKLDEKMYKHMAKVPVWSIGPVVAPGTLVLQTKQVRELEPNAPVGLKRTVERHSRFWSMQSGRQAARGAEGFPATRDVVTACPHWGAVVPRREDAEEFGVMRLSDIPGFSVHVGRRSMKEKPPQVLSKEMFQRFNLRAFDYDTSFNRPYRCIKEPAMFPLKPLPFESSTEAGPAKRGASADPENGREKRRRIEDDESEDDVEDTDSNASTDSDMSDDDDAMEPDDDDMEPTDQTPFDEPVEGTSHEMITPAPSNIVSSQENEKPGVARAEHSQNKPAQDDAQSEVQNVLHVETQVEPQVETQPNDQADIQANTEADPQVETQIETQADPQANKDADNKASTHAETQTENQVETQTDTQVDTQADTQATTESDNQSPAHADAQTDNQTEAQAANTEAMAQADIQMEAQADLQADTQADTQTSTHTDTQANTQVETPGTTEAKGDDDAPVETQIEAQADPQADTQADTQASTHTDTQADTQVEIQADAQADTETETQNA